MLNSKLLSGGFESKYLYILSKKSREEMAAMSNVADNHEMQEILLTTS